MKLNILGNILKALAFTGKWAKGLTKAAVAWSPKRQFRGATAERTRRTPNPRSAPKQRQRGHMTKAFESYCVRYTNRFSRKQGRERLMNEAAKAYNARNKKLGNFLQLRAAAFPWS